MTDDESGKLELFAGVGGEQTLDPASALKGQIAALLWEKRYEEALELLYAARWHTPDAAEISRGINLLKERLVRRYVEQLGDLDAVPSLAPGVNRATLEIADEERALLHLIDGISSFADIAHQSRLGRFETYRALGRVVREGIVQVAPPPPPTPLSGPRRAGAAMRSDLSAASSMEETTPKPEVTPHRWRGLVVGAVSFAITGAAGLTWWAITGSAPSLHPAAAVASVPAPPTAKMSIVHEVRGSAAPERAPGAHPVALLEPEAKPAAPEASRPAAPLGAPGTVGRSARSAAKSEERSKKRSSSRGAAVEASVAVRPHGSSAAGAITRAPAPASSPVPPAEDGDAPSLPELGERAPATARPGALAASFSAPARPAPSGAPQPPPGLVKASATSFAPTSLSIATNDLTVRGPIGRSVVEQALARAQADFRGCYAARAGALGRHAAGTARISLTIDEAGYATAVSAQGAPLPGLDACLQEAARRIRTRVHPDVGVAAVTFTVAFSIGGAAP